MNRDFFIALDFSTSAEAISLVKMLPTEHLYYKIGMELFFREGERILYTLAEAGKRVFLDLKLYDIPNTVSRAIASLAAYPFYMVNVHLLGGEMMVREALVAAHHLSFQPRVIGVTILTSYDIDALAAIFPGNERILPEEWARYLAVQGKQWGIEGVVCSPHEAALIKESCGNDFLTVTPGIRFSDEKAHDQKRVATPERARREGCDFPVVGRAITEDFSKAESNYERFLFAWNV